MARANNSTMIEVGAKVDRSVGQSFRRIGDDAASARKAATGGMDVDRKEIMRTGQAQRGLNKNIDQTNTTLRKQSRIFSQAGDDARAYSRRLRDAATNNNFFSKSADAVGNGIDSLANRWTALATGAAGLGSAKMVADLETRYTYLGIQANKPEHEIATIKRNIAKVADMEDIKIAPDSILSAVEKIVEKTGDLELAKKNIETIGYAVRAANADGVSIGGLVADFKSKFNIDTPEQMRKMIDMMVLQGKSGAFTLQYLAQEAENVTAAYAGMGRTGPAALQEMGALLQIAKAGKGSPSEAVTAFESVLEDLVSKEKLVANLGVQLWDEEQLNNGKKVARSIPAVIKELVRETQADVSQLSKIFGETGIAGIKPIMIEYQQTGKFETLDKYMQIHGTGNQLIADSTKAAKTANAALQSVKTAWEHFADSTLSGPLKSAADAINSLEPETIQAAFKAIAVGVGAIMTVAAGRKVVSAGRSIKSMFTKPEDGKQLDTSIGGVQKVFVTNMPADGFGGSDSTSRRRKGRKNKKTRGRRQENEGQVDRSVGNTENKTQQSKPTENKKQDSAANRSVESKATQTKADVDLAKQQQPQPKPQNVKAAKPQPAPVSRSVRGALSNSVGVAGRAAPVLGVAVGAINASATLLDDSLTAAEKTQQVSRDIGGAGGAVAGAMAGAAIGSAVPVIGTAVGSIVGGILGHFGGNWLGGLTGDWLTTENEDKSPVQVERTIDKQRLEHHTASMANNEVERSSEKVTNNQQSQELVTNTVERTIDKQRLEHHTASMANNEVERSSEKVTNNQQSQELVTNTVERTIDKQRLEHHTASMANNEVERSSEKVTNNQQSQELVTNTVERTIDKQRLEHHTASMANNEVERSSEKVTNNQQSQELVTNTVERTIDKQRLEHHTASMANNEVERSSEKVTNNQQSQELVTNTVERTIDKQRLEHHTASMANNEVERSSEKVTNNQQSQELVTNTVERTIDKQRLEHHTASMANNEVERSSEKVTNNQQSQELVTNTVERTIDKQRLEHHTASMANNEVERSSEKVTNNQQSQELVTNTVERTIDKQRLEHHSASMANNEVERSSEKVTNNQQSQELVTNTVERTIDKQRLEHHSASMANNEVERSSEKVTNNQQSQELVTNTVERTIDKQRLEHHTASMANNEVERSSEKVTNNQQSQELVTNTVERTIDKQRLEHHSASMANNHDNQKYNHEFKFDALLAKLEKFIDVVIPKPKRFEQPQQTAAPITIHMVNNFNGISDNNVINQIKNQIDELKRQLEHDSDLLAFGDS